MTAIVDLGDGAEVSVDAIIQTGWSAGFGYGGMATIFRLDGKFHAAPSISDYARKNLTVKEARHLVTNGKTVEFTPPHL